MAYNEKLATQSFVQESIENTISSSFETTDKVELGNNAAVTSEAVYKELNSFYKYSGKTISTEIEGNETLSNMKPNEYCDVYIPSEWYGPLNLIWDECISGPVTISTNDYGENEISMQLTIEECKDLELTYSTYNQLGVMVFYPIVDGVEGDSYSDMGYVDIDIDNGIFKVTFNGIEVPECSFAKIEIQQFEMFLNKNGKLIKNQYHGYKFIQTSNINYTMEVESDHTTIPTGAAVSEAIANSKEQILTDVNTVHVMGEAIDFGDTTGFAAGTGAMIITKNGGAIGAYATAYDGGAIGYNTETDRGGAIGCNAMTGNGFAGGYNAQTVTELEDMGIDAIQLGTGTNNYYKTLQIYNHQLLDESGKIPNDRLKANYHYMGECTPFTLPDDLKLDDKGCMYKITEDGPTQFTNEIFTNQAWVESKEDKIIGIIIHDYYLEQYLDTGKKVIVKYIDYGIGEDFSISTTITEKIDKCTYKVEALPEQADYDGGIELQLIIDDIVFEAGEYAYWNGVQWEVIENVNVGKKTDDGGEIFNNYIDNTASGYYSHAEGGTTTAFGDCSHAEGSVTTAFGESSHAEGQSTYASGGASHAEGYLTETYGEASHAEGCGTITVGDYSHAEGYNAYTNGDYSHAEGYSTIADSEYQHVQGKYNIRDANNKYAHIVGNGHFNEETGEEILSNAHTLDWNGNAWFAGEIKIGGIGQDDSNAQTIATENYVETKIGDIEQALDESIALCDSYLSWEVPV